MCKNQTERAIIIVNFAVSSAKIMTCTQTLLLVEKAHLKHERRRTGSMQFVHHRTGAIDHSCVTHASVLLNERFQKLNLSNFLGLQSNWVMHSSRILTGRHSACSHDARTNPRVCNSAHCSFLSHFCPSAKKWNHWDESTSPPKHAI